MSSAQLIEERGLCISLSHHVINTNDEDKILCIKLFRKFRNLLTFKFVNETINKIN